MGSRPDRSDRRDKHGRKRQPSEFQHEFKSSWSWVRAPRSDIDQLTERLRTAGIGAHVEYSCRCFLDVVPAVAGKGNALAWLCQRLRIPLGKVLAAGGADNDAGPFLPPGAAGIAVENALPELRAATMRRPIFIAASGTAEGDPEGSGNGRLPAGHIPGGGVTRRPSNRSEPEKGVQSDGHRAKSDPPFLRSCRQNPQAIGSTDIAPVAGPGRSRAQDRSPA